MVTHKSLGSHEKTLLRDKIIADDSDRKVIVKVNRLEKKISLTEMQYNETKIRIL